MTGPLFLLGAALPAATVAAAIRVRSSRDAPSPRYGAAARSE